MERFIPVEIFQKKTNTFRGITFFPVLTETSEIVEIFCSICLDYQCQASCREKVKNLPVFCKWYNSIPFLFSVTKKKYQYHLTKIFRRNFRTNGKRSTRTVKSTTIDLISKKTTTLQVPHTFLYIPWSYLPLFCLTKGDVGSFNAISGNTKNNGEMNKCSWTNKTS